MAVPDFQSLMLPLLRVAADAKEHSLAEAREKLADEFKLSHEDHEELLPSGRQSKFSNRVAWAKSYLQQAGLLSSPRRGHFQVSARGSEILKSPPDRIDISFLEQYPEFVAFRTPKAESMA
jgi:restriction system protein